MPLVVPGTRGGALANVGVLVSVHVVEGDIATGRGVKSSLLLLPVAWVRRGYEKLGHRRFACVVALTGLFLTAPSITTGFSQDDHILQLVYSQHPSLAGLELGITDNFVFADGDPVTNGVRFELGMFPWWAVPDWQVSFWRPLASLTHWLEFRVFGAWPLPMHVTSVLLYGGLCLAALVLFRRVHAAAWTAGLAGLMFAMDPVHGIPAGWISDRNALLSALFGILALICHDRWRRDGGGLVWGLGALVCLGVGLFCGEAAVSVGAFLFAYQVFLDPVTRVMEDGGNQIPLNPPFSKGEFRTGKEGNQIPLNPPFSKGETGMREVGSQIPLNPPFSKGEIRTGKEGSQIPLSPPFSKGETRRGIAWKLWAGILVLLPYLGVVVVWRVVYVWMGYGVHGSWMYLDPAEAPLEFLKRVFWFVPIFLQGAFALPDGVAWNFVPDSWALIWSGIAVVFLAGMCWLMGPTLRRHAAARFWLLGAVLSTVPCCATIPGDRIVTFPALGAVGLVAIYLGDLLARGRAGAGAGRWALARGYAGVFVLSHLLLAPVALAGASTSIVMMHDFFARANDSLSEDAGLASRKWVVLRTPLDMLGASMSLFRTAEGEAAPAAWRYLYAGMGALTIERVDARTLVLTPEGGYLPEGICQIFRNSEVYPMAAGYTKQVGGMTAEVLAVDAAGKPTAARFVFDGDLDDASYRFVHWVKGVYVPVGLPRVGEAVVLPGTTFEEILGVVMKWE